jgi:hypothetical protein
MRRFNLLIRLYPLWQEDRRINVDTIRPWSILAVIIVLGGSGVTSIVEVPLQSGDNLLQDPSFEDAPSGNWQWNFWSYQVMVMKDDNKKEPDLDKSFFAPNFLPSESEWDKESNGSEGTAGAISNQAWTKFRAGFYQTVDVAPGTCVHFSVWANEFCQTDDNQSCPILLRAGIDPSGGNNWMSDDVLWVGTTISSREYTLLTVPLASVGQRGRVTVFTWGEPLYPVHYSSAYFDEASLVVVADTCKQTFLPMILSGR